MAERTLAISAGLARGPKIVRAGSPGTMCTSNDKTTVTINSTKIVIRIRFKR
jgi:hypothetical protein